MDMLPFFTSGHRIIATSSTFELDLWSIDAGVIISSAIVVAPAVRLGQQDCHQTARLSLIFYSLKNASKIYRSIFAYLFCVVEEQHAFLSSQRVRGQV